MPRKPKEQTRTEKLYFRDVNKYKLLTEEEELKLIEDVHNKVPGAEEKLITANLRFVAREARKYKMTGGLSFLEIVNEGNIGLLKAAKRFDCKKNIKFISYAVWWIKQAIQKSIFDRMGTIHIPANKITLLKNFKREFEKQNGDFEKTMELPEFAKSREDIIEVMQKSKNISLEKSMAVSGDDDNSMSLLDMLGVDPSQNEEVMTNELCEEIENVIHFMPILSEVEEKVIRMYYGINFSSTKTLEEIGAELNITREKVRLTRDKALKKLYRDKDARERLKEFLNYSINDGFSV